MKKILSICLSLLMGGSIFVASAASTGSKHLTKAEAMKFIENKKYTNAGEVAKRLSNQTRKNQWLSGISKTSSVDTSASIKAQGWSFLLGPDGKQWSYTQSWEYNTDNSTYKSSTITFYNQNHVQVGQVVVDVSDIANVNDIQVSSDISSKFFDYNSNTYEILVWYHTALNGVTSYVTRSYRLDGTLLGEYEGSSIFVDASYDWTTYQRMITVNSVVEDSVEYAQINVYKNASYSGDPSIEHTFKVDMSKLNYVSGSYFNFTVIDNNPYFIISQYEKDFVSGYDTTTWDFIITEDNHFITTVYDKNYNVVGVSTVPIDTPEDAYLRMAGFGMLSDIDLSKNYFTNNDNFDYVITWDDYILSSDDDRYKFEVFNSANESVGVVCDNVYNTYYTLADVEGQETQMMFMQIVDGVEQIQTVDMPSLTKVATIPATIDGETISTDLNRYKKDDSYQYVIKLTYGTSDSEGNVIARLGWYNKDLSLDRYVSFNLGPNAENFRPGLLDEMINPYLFDTDDEMEYIYFAKVRNSSGTALEDLLTVANEDGSVIATFSPDETKGVLYTSMVLTTNVDQPELVVCYADDDYENYVIDFFTLPFNKFEKGGDGTANNPYMISTVGDLLQINYNTSAYYKLANGIDMSKYGTWSPLNTFTGQLDGDNYYIKDLKVSSSETYSGLFSTLYPNAVIKNLVFIDPEVELTSDNSYAGVLSGASITAAVNNVHVFGADIEDETGSSSAAVGGFIGQATVYTTISESSFDGNINASASSYVGGIIGDARTSSTVDVAAVTGDINGSRYVGGIIGAAYSGSNVSNSHVDAAITAKNSVGGIVGYNQGRVIVSKCYADGSITATTKPAWGGLGAGGIVGDLETDWEQVDTEDVDSVVANCVNIANINIPALESGEEADETVHRIVGTSMINETWYDGETPVAEKGLYNNYAASTVLVGGSAITSTDAASTEGATIESASLGKTFFNETLGYAYGTDSISPWKGESNELPLLYFEESAKALTISDTSVSVAKDQSCDITISVYGTTANAINVTVADESIATITTVEDDVNESVEVTIVGKAEGTTVVTATADGLTVDCTVTVSAESGVVAPTAVSSLLIKATDSTISATGATSIAVYNVSGQTVAVESSDSVDASALSSGVYIVVATDEAGQTVTGKVVVK